MALAYDSVATGPEGASATCVSGSIDGSGSNVVLIVGTGNTGSDTSQPTGVAWNAAGGDQAFTKAVGLGAQSYFSSSIWWITGHDAETATVTATWGASQDSSCIYVAKFTGADQTTPIGDTGSDSDDGTGGTTTVTLTGVNSADIIIDCLIQDYQGTYPTESPGDADQVERVDIASDDVTFDVGLNMSTMPGTGGTAVWWNQDSGTAPMIYTAVVVKPASGSILQQIMHHRQQQE